MAEHDALPSCEKASLRILIMQTLVPKSQGSITLNPSAPGFSSATITLVVLYEPQVRFQEGGLLRCYQPAFKGDQLYRKLVVDGHDSVSRTFLSGHIEPDSANETNSIGTQVEISAPGV